MSSAHEPFDMQIKLLMIGDSGVGKTCLLLRYASDTFVPTFITTIGIDFKIKNINLDGKKVKLQIWDTAGQERFKTITTSYFKGAQGIMLVYDVTDRQSFENVRRWKEQIQQHADKNVNCILVGNKVDNKERRVVSTEEGARLAKNIDSTGAKVSDLSEMGFFESSAKENINVQEVREERGFSKNVELFYEPACLISIC
eukprot:TRINITY_DN3754_c0_g1_i1.p1 TRINITY_DN3754_c0_g1~~TRINITY_DN3754_c0_g1_i1.p1  ORF type:complete len:199 (-),score=37.60 TRINITY_DN3754_c0_g1_i1:30-626(-)